MTAPLHPTLDGLGFPDGDRVPEERGRGGHGGQPPYKRRHDPRCGDHMADDPVWLRVHDYSVETR